MNQDEMRRILSGHLARFRSRPARLAGRVESDRQSRDCLDHIEDEAADGTRYQIEFQAYWDDKPQGDIRVSGSFWAEPQGRLLGVLPIFIPDVTDCFILRPDGSLVDEPDSPGL